LQQLQDAINQWCLEKYNKLVDFSKKEQEHCMVPHLYETDKSLGQWVSIQAKKNKQQILCEADQKEMLDKFGLFGRST
jgi:hypothetical protein